MRQAKTDSGRRPDQLAERGLRGVERARLTLAQATEALDRDRARESQRRARPRSVALPSLTHHKCSSARVVVGELTRQGLDDLLALLAARLGQDVGARRAGRHLHLLVR